MSQLLIAYHWSATLPVYLVYRAYADSKTLTEAQRESLFAAIQLDEQLAYSADVLGASFISSQMLGRYINHYNSLHATP